jgi:uncharacterized protein with von Willebrand factor type A (vWA) domain
MRASLQTGGVPIVLKYRPRRPRRPEIFDSVIAAYEQYCTTFECWRTDQLEDFVKALTRPEVA